jgi:formate C-acetyltransferase
LRKAAFDYDPLEAFVGRLRLDADVANNGAYDDAVEYLERYPSPPGQTGHCELDLSRVMSLGIDGLVLQISGLRDSAAGDRRDVYQSFLHALEGLCGMMENAADTPGLEPETAADCRRIAHHPPESFRQALQLLWLTLLGLMYGEDVGLVVPGHMDRILYPFYAADRDRKRVSTEQALLLIENLYLFINDFIPDGLAMSVMVGGRDAEGNDVTNELSYLCLDGLRRTRLIYPTVGVCWHEGTPPDLVDLAVDLIGHGNPTPAFFGDETIQRGLRALGVPPAQSHYYVNSTCVEITPAGSSNVWVASPYFPLCQILIDEIAEQVGAGNVAEDFDTFRARYLDRLGRHIAAAVEAENESRRRRRECGRKPLQSVFTRDCIDRGRDIDDGGARYNWVECSFVGMANLADSLYVLREEVFNTKRLSLAQLKEFLDADFVGYETERRRFLQGYPKYGQGSAELDALVGETVAFLREECAKHRIEPDGSPYVPGGFCWVMHEVLGRACGATPDGRKAGWPFADGCGPAQGRETRGPRRQSSPRPPGITAQ